MRQGTQLDPIRGGLAALCLLLTLPGHALAAAEKPGDALDLYFDDATLVETATRASKPLSQVAENVSIVTAQEIEALNAHSLFEVLERLPGISVAYNGGNNLNGFGEAYLQGSRGEHVLVLLDGVRFNTASGGNVAFFTIPLGIIERIEIIKGPASAAWGSSLGGVINILTRKAGTTAIPSGSLFASRGEAETWEASGDAAGAIGRLGYYLYADHQETDGFVADRWFRGERLYGKGDLALPGQAKLILTLGLSDPAYKTGDFPNLDFSEQARDRHAYGTASLDAPLGQDFNFHLAARRLTRDFQMQRDFLGLAGLFAGAGAGAHYYSETWEEESSGLSTHLAWHPSGHQVLLGADLHRGEVSKTTRYGAWAQGNWGAPDFDPVPPVFEQTWGVYCNDTMTLGNWTVTPGVRYDNHSIAKNLVSPSLGVAWRVRADTVARAGLAQGFVHPILSYLKVGDWATSANANLRPEKITSYQVGVETNALPPVRLKTSLFLHEVKESWVNNLPWENGADLRRQGLELEAETRPVAGVSALANLTWIDFLPENTKEHDYQTVANLILRYDNEALLRAELAGHYIWWDQLQNAVGSGNRYGRILWDLRLSRRILATDRTETRAFVTVRNLFNAYQTQSWNYVNPDRWVEAGVRVRF